jgi:hypothetical protein
MVARRIVRRSASAFVQKVSRHAVTVSGADASRSDAVVYVTIVNLRATVDALAWVLVASARNAAFRGNGLSVKVL